MRKRKSAKLVATGIAGLDEILRGGLPPSNLYMMQGAPGAGKTTAALQFLRAGVEAGERCIYVSLSQTAAELELIATSHGWTMDGIRIEELSASDAVHAHRILMQPKRGRVAQLGQGIRGVCAHPRPLPSALR